MKLNEYFDKAKGVGVLATSDASGVVNAAVYSRPHFVDEHDDEHIAFIMADRLTYANVQTNPHAAFVFVEDGQGFQGQRLHLTKSGEETDDDLVAAICRRCNYNMYGRETLKHVVFFKVDKVMPLVGPGTL